jgi:hypothetical protein
MTNGKHQSNLLTTTLAVVAAVVLVSNASAQSDKNDAPIRYDSSPAKDRVAKLMDKMAAGEVSFEWDEKHGWLPLLEHLEVPRASQTLVFSKTSQQNRKIRPSTPRAIYFNDDVYVGYVTNGDFLELGAVDPAQGARFYAFDQAKAEYPTLKKASDQCMACHETRKTQDVPGFLIRSVFPKKSGHPDFTLGTDSTGHSTPLKKRFGGWYVTGNHGSMRHRGNVFVNRDEGGEIDHEAGANLNQLPSIANAEGHLEPTSDIVALMLMEHQVQFHNFVTKASYTARQTRHYDTQMNRVFERDAGHRSESSTRRIDAAAEKLVAYTLFADEFRFSSPVRGAPEFVKQFSKTAVRTSDGRSLRDLDLQTRLLKYPCSYLVYTESFNALPDEILSVVKEKMLAVLNGNNDVKEFDHLTAADRKNILEILTETHPLFKKQ